MFKNTKKDSSERNNSMRIIKLYGVNIKDFMFKYKGYICTILIVILSIVSIIIQDSDKKNALKVNGNNITTNNNKITIYITGEVKKEGVYSIDSNSRLSDALDVCGGVLETADINSLNLAQKLNDSDKIVVPKKVEKSEIKEDEESSDLKEDVDNTSEKININTATKEELETLPGVGESTANKIIEHRKKERFTQKEDIMNVKGIGQSKYDSMKEYISI